MEEPHPAVSEALHERLLRVHDDVRQTLAKVDSFDLIMHEWKPSAFPKFTLFIYIDKESVEKFISLAGDLKTINRQFADIDDEHKSNEKSEELNSVRTKEVFGDVESLPNDVTSNFEQWKFEARQVGDLDCVVVTNTDFLESVFDKEVSATNSGQLSSTRRYKSYESFLARNQPRNATLLMTSFVEPSRLRPLFDPKNNASLWKALGIEELPVAAVQLSLDDDGVFVADTMITMTQPPSGTAAKWLAYRPLDAIPVIEDSSVTMSASGIDYRQAIQQQLVFYETAYGENTFLTEVLRYYGRNDDEFLEHLGKRANQKVMFEVMTEGGRTDLLIFERVANRESMEVVMGALTEAEDRRFADRDLKCERTETDGNILWSYPDSEALRKLFRPTAYAIVGDWSFQGTQSLVKHYYDQFCQDGMLDRPWQDVLSPNTASRAAAFQPVALTKIERES